MSGEKGTMPTEVTDKVFFLFFRPLTVQQALQLLLLLLPVPAHGELVALPLLGGLGGRVHVLGAPHVRVEERFVCVGLLDLVPIRRSQRSCHVAREVGLVLAPFREGGELLVREKLHTLALVLDLVHQTHALPSRLQHVVVPPLQDARVLIRD